MYRYAKEKREVISKTQLGDRANSKKVYVGTSLLFSPSFENVELPKISIMEILMTLTRESGKRALKIQKVFGMGYRLVIESPSLRDEETLCLCVVKLLVKITDITYQIRHARKYE